MIFTLLYILMIFGINEKSLILTHTMTFLHIATNISVLLMIGFVVQGHMYVCMYFNSNTYFFKAMIFFAPVLCQNLT